MGVIGRKHTIEELKKMSLAQKGRIITVETRKKIGSANRGKVRTKEMRKRISEGHKGLKFSKEHCEKIGLSNHLHPRVRKHSLETKEKISQALRGDRNHSWKGGITSLARKIRGSYLYRLWRKEILEKDNYTCQICGYRNNTGLGLQADHFPETFSFVLKKFNIKKLEEALACNELWLIKDNRILCFSCHKKTFTYSNRNQR